MQRPECWRVGSTESQSTRSSEAIAQGAARAMQSAGAAVVLLAALLAASATCTDAGLLPLGDEILDYLMCGAGGADLRPFPVCKLSCVASSVCIRRGHEAGYL